MEIIDSKKEYRQGIISVLMCNCLWGCLPIYWQWLIPIDSITIIYYRIFLVAMVCLGVALKVHTREEILAPLRNRSQLMRLIIAGLVITINWSIYIYAVNSGRVIQTSIGYYMEPLVVCLFGMFIFKEKANKYKAFALVMGAIGVLAVILYFKQVPVIALGVSISFSIYAAIKRGLQMPPTLSLLYETIFLAPIALVIIIAKEINGTGALAVATPGRYVLLLLCGFLTALPLMLFANAANKTNMFILGLTEYISPTIALIISIFYFKEDFAPVQLIAFAIIWVGLVFFSIGEFREYKADKTDINP